MITVGQAARYDALDALVPALATHDDCATAIDVYKRQALGVSELHGTKIVPLGV